MRHLYFILFLTATYSVQAQFLPPIELKGGLTLPYPEISDVDSDGDMDLIVSSPIDNKIVWYANDGTGVFGEEIIIDSTGIDSPYYLIPADMNGDGLEDLIIETHYSFDGVPPYRLLYYENLGGGVFAEEVTIVESLIEDFGISDLDGDGDLDVFYANTGENVYWVQNDGLGAFASPITLVSSFPLEEKVNIEAADYDNDGDNDLIVGTSLQAVLFDNLGGGAFASDITLFDPELGFNYFGDMKVVDLNGDDFPEIVGHFIIGNVGYSENLGGSAGPLNTVGIGGDGGCTGQNVVASDILLNDGNPEILWSGGFVGIRAQLNNGEDFLDTINFFPGEWGELLCNPRNMNIVDLNLDGRQDILMDFNGTNVVIFYSADSTSSCLAGGTIFHDINEDGVFDPDEIGYSGIPLNRSPFGMTFTETEGAYTFGLGGEEGTTYTIGHDLAPIWAITTPDSYDVDVVHGAFIDTLDFGFYPIELLDTVIANTLNLPLRCNENRTFIFEVQNVGTTFPSGLVELILDDSLTYVTSEIAPDSIVDQHIYWHYDTLDWFGEMRYELTVFTPDGIDDAITNFYHFTVDSLDGPVFILEDSVTMIVTCAYDPNDKSVLPAGETELGYIPVETEGLEYTVRFQNTGTDTALNVVIRDQLDPNLDWTSLVPLSNSHEMTVGISLDGLATFTFNDIYLPDSNVNEAASHGAFKYRVNLNEGLPVGTVINNRADIYFDFNPPILTNITINTLYACESWIDSLVISNLTVCLGDTIYATYGALPAFADYTWSLDGELIDEDSFELYESGSHELELSIFTDDCIADTTIELIVAEGMIEELETLEICIGDSILIFDTYQSTTGFYTDTLVSEITGCDSVLYQELLLNILPEVNMGELADTMVCTEHGTIGLTGEPIGGIYSGIGVSGDEFNPAIAGEGTYTLYYSYEDANGCSAIDSSKIQVINCLGIGNEIANTITVRPNPFQDFTTVYFDSPLTNNHAIILCDILGQEVYRIENIVGNSIIIEKDRLGTGIFMLRLIDQDSGLYSTVKLIAQ